MRYTNPILMKMRLEQIEKSAPRWMWAGVIVALVGALTLVVVTVANHDVAYLGAPYLDFGIPAVVCGWFLVASGAACFVRGFMLESEAADCRTNLGAWPDR